MKKFLEEKKRELKFKLAGPGHKLSENSKTRPDVNNPGSASLNAALKRCEKKQPDKNSASDTKEKDIASSTSIDQDMNAGASSSNEIVLFHCNEFGNEVYTLDVWREKFRRHIENVKSNDPVFASILAIKSLNPDQEAQTCVKLLEKYVTNLIQHPDIEKYKLIRLGNTNVQKMLSVEGAIEFLYAIGFENKSILNEKEQKEEAYLIHNVKPDGLDLNGVIESLDSVKGFVLTLHRNLKIILPDKLSKSEEIPDEFYEWTSQDIRKEHMSRMTELEKNLQLRTKKMREIDNKGKVKSKLPTDYTFIRVRFPDGLIVQVIFSITEKLSDLRSILSEKIEFLDSYSFVSLPAKIYDEVEEDKSFLKLDLYPAVMLMIKWSEPNLKHKYKLK